MQPWKKDALVIKNSKGGNRKFTLADLLDADDRKQFDTTTAGLEWYQQSIAFFDMQERYYVACLGWGKILVVDMETNKLLGKIPDELNSSIHKKVRAKAIALLDSSDKWSRESGAVLCGAYKAREAIPKLKKLLKDSGYMLSVSLEPVNKSTRVYVVRIAAKKSLESMGENIKGVVTKEEVAF